MAEYKYVKECHHCWHFLSESYDTEYYYRKYLCCFCGQIRDEKVLVSCRTIAFNEESHGPYIREVHTII